MKKKSFLWVVLLVVLVLVLTFDNWSSWLTGKNIEDKYVFIVNEGENQTFAFGGVSYIVNNTATYMVNKIPVGVNIILKDLTNKLPGESAILYTDAKYGVGNFTFFNSTKVEVLEIKGRWWKQGYYAKFVITKA